MAIYKFTMHYKRYGGKTENPPEKKWTLTTVLYYQPRLAFTIHSTKRKRRVLI